MNYQGLLRAKAFEVCDLCTAKGLPKPTFVLVEQNYLINFTWLHEGKKQMLSLYYKPTRQSWTLFSKSDWLKSVVIPIIEPLCQSASIGTAVAPASSACTLPDLPHTGIQAYFEDALSCLELLSPFAADNVDCSIICQLTRRAAKYILSDPACSYLDQTTLATHIELPDSTDFSAAKEYLNQCLTLCHMSNAAN